MTDHECCFHLMEVLGDRRIVQRCCFCDQRKTITYQPPETEHGRFIYR